MRFVVPDPITLILTAAVTLVNANARPVGENPNVLLIVTDDQGWGDLRSNGNAKIDTPNLDALAESGMRLERFYVCPNCAPTRASLLTGRYHYRTGVTSVSRGEEVMQAHEVTIAEVFRENGYATGCFGKWHNGSNWPHHPNGQGFDEFTGLCQGHWNHYFDAELEHNGKPHPTEGFVTDVLTERAIDFMETNLESDRPFLCYLPYNTPHSPFQAPDALFEKYRKRDLDDKTAAVYAMVESIDGNVGRLLEKLDEWEISDNTVVWFLSDNGPAIRKNDEHPRFNGGLYAARGSVHEGGVRVPSFVRWPGVIPEKSRFRKITAHIDVLPTLADLCGLQSVETLPLDGMNLSPVLRLGDLPGGWPNRLFFTSWTPAGYDTRNASVAARTDRWIAVRDSRWRRGKPSDTHSGWELYDLNADRFQRRNLADDFPYLLSDMRADFSRWMDHTTDDGLGSIPTEIGHDEWPVVTLRAQDAVIPRDWKIKRGNNSRLSDWKNTDWTATWRVKVVESGKYTIEIRYAFAPQQIPCRMKLTLGDRSLEFAVDQAFTAEPIPSPDRYQRGEFSAQTWNTIEVGEIDLESGSGELTLQPLEITGEAIELKDLIFRAR